MRSRPRPRRWRRRGEPTRVSDIPPDQAPLPSGRGCPTTHVTKHSLGGKADGVSGRAGEGSDSHNVEPCASAGPSPPAPLPEGEGSARGVAPMEVFSHSFDRFHGHDTPKLNTPTIARMIGGQMP